MKATGVVRRIDDLGRVVIPKENVDALESALAKLLEDADLCEKLGQAAKQKLEQEYSVEKIWNQYMDIWQRKER